MVFEVEGSLNEKLRLVLKVATNKKKKKKKTQTPWTLVRKRTIPTERPPLVGEI
jgi:hypothetical protein